MTQSKQAPQVPNNKFHLEGVMAIRAAIEAESRQVFVLHVEGDNTSRPIRHLKRDAKAAGVKVKRHTRAELDELAEGKTHGGAVAAVGPRRYAELEQVGPTANGFVVMLDGIEDPYNFGYTLRSLYAAGADGLVVRPRNWTTAAATVGRASAGASERLPIAVAEDALSALEHFKARGYTTAVTAKTDDATDLYAAGLAGPMFLLIGGEKRGVSRAALDAADLKLALPYGRDFDASLGTVAAASAVAFEVLRQRRALAVGSP